MKKIFIILTVISLIGQNIWAQKLSSSPYSRLGIGDILFQGNGRQLSMGKTGIADFSSYHLSKVNPATYSALKPNSVIFETSFFHKISDYTDGNIHQINNVSNFKQLMGGFRLKHWWHTSFGLSPYSGVGYQIQAYDTLILNDYSVAYASIYSGNGGITQLFWGNSFTFFNNFSVGVNLNYNFGAFNRYSETIVSDTLATTVTRMSDRKFFKKFTYDFGFIYQDTIKDGYTHLLKYSVGGIFSNSFDVNTYNTLNVSRTISAYGQTFSDSIFFDTLGMSSMTLPLTFGAGISLTYKDRYTLTADYLVRKWSGTSILGNNNFTDSRFIGVGFEYVNAPFSTIYWKTIRYRAGAYQNNSYKIFNGGQINTQAITFGIGFPVKTIQLNLGFVVGQTGSLDLGLKENFYEFNLSISLYDLWFVKRKFM